MRQQINLIGFGGYQGPGGGKKGKGTGNIPVGGTSQTAKGGGGGKKGGKKGPPDYTINVDFGICEGGGVDIPGDHLVFASAEVTHMDQIPLNLYKGDNGQPIDATFESLGPYVNYSGTCHVTATPMNLGSTPVIPNLSFEVKGLFAGTSGSYDANVEQILTHFLTDAQRGAGFPIANIDTASLSDFGLYCDQVGMKVSVSLNGQQTGLDWLSGFLKLLNTTMVWSGSLLRFIPYGDLPVGAWSPNMNAQYELTDDDFLSDTKLEGSELTVAKDDPIEVTRVNPNDAANWVSMQYLDRSNYYNSTVLAAFDQSAIDAFGLRTGDNLQGMQFCDATSAQMSCQLYLQRLQYIRNTPYKFKVGWKYSLLEPMDILLITGNFGDAYLNNEAVRITSIEEDDNGDLTIEAEQLQTTTDGISTSRLT